MSGFAPSPSLSFLLSLAFLSSLPSLSFLSFPPFPLRNGGGESLPQGAAGGGGPLL